MSDVPLPPWARSLRRRTYRVFRRQGLRAATEFALREIVRTLVVVPAVEQAVDLIEKQKPSNGGKSFGTSPLC